MLRGPKSVRTAMSAAVAGIVGLVPAVLIASPAHAAVVVGAYSIADAKGVEGGNVVFTITRVAPGAGNTQAEETLAWSTTNGTASAASGDFTAVTSGTVTFPANSNETLAQTRTISVATLQDTVDESDDESFTVTIAGQSFTPQLSSDLSATGTIDDDDDPTFTLNSSPTTVLESTPSLTRKATITATLSATSTSPIVIPVSTKDGTAKAGQDYTAVDTVINVPANQLSGSITVNIADDALDEDDIQSFTVVSSAGVNVAGTQTATVNISDDDAAPVLSIASAGAAAEGGYVNFNASLSGLSEKSVTASWNTSDGATGAQASGHNNAKAGDDYTAVTGGTVTFLPETTTPTTPIKVKSSFDDLDEATEDLSVTLSSPSNATLGTAAVTGSINDSGTTPGPQVILAPTEITEGSATTSRARTFKVKLSKASGREQKVTYAVGIGAGTAESSDFIATNATTLTFAAGETEKSFTVDVIGDNIDEGTGETFTITLSDGSLGSPLATGGSLKPNLVTITDDDDTPVLSLGRSEISLDETDGPAAALFEIKLSNPTEASVDWTAGPAGNAGTAEPTGSGPGDDDYDVLNSLTGSFTGGQTSAYVLFIINGDTVYETDETVKYTVVRTANDPDATGGPLAATLTIKNDDKAPVLEVDSVSGKEGETVALTGTVTGVAEDDTLLSLKFAGASVDGSKAADANDFTNPGVSTVKIDGGTASASEIDLPDVELLKDNSSEPAETILVSGSGFGSTGSVVDGVITIAANGTTPTDPTDPTDPDDPDAEAPTLTASSSFRLGAGKVTLTGKAADGASVELWGRTADSDDDAYEKIDETEAGSNGAFSFTPELSTDGMYFKAMIGDETSDPVKVNVKEDPDITASSTSKGVVRLTVTGDPKIHGLEARVFRANANGTWTMVGSGVLNSSGTFSKVLSNQASGKTATFRAWVKGDADRGVLTNYSSYSKPVRVK